MFYTWLWTILLSLRGKPMQTITIMPDHGGAYAWLRADDVPPWYGVGGNIAGFGGWGGDQPISDDLEEAFITWQSEFESYAWVETESPAGSRYSRFDWASFHARGLELVTRLKAELGDSATVIYEKPCEDIGCDVNERTEVLAGGGLKPLPSRKELAALDPTSAK